MNISVSTPPSNDLSHHVTDTIEVAPLLMHV